MCCEECSANCKRNSNIQKYCKDCSKRIRTERLRKSNQKYALLNKEKTKIRQALWYVAHREEHNVYTKAYYAEHREVLLAKARANPEITTVRNHHRNIFKACPSYKNYAGMPFANEWNPDKGGSFQAGADWIIANIGKRPQGTSLHIVDHGLGFVPGNLEWTHPRKQNREQMVKIIARQRHQIKLLEKRLAA